MSLFWIGAILILAGSIAALVWPLARERAQRGVALVVAVAVAVVSVLLYREWSNWDRTQAAEAAEQSAMLGSLARRLERNPEDVEGWLMLGRSQLAIGQYPLAQRAFRRADRLEDGRNPEALLGMAEAMVLQADGEVDDRSGRLFEMALELAPRSEKALFFSAVAAQKWGETALAIERAGRELSTIFLFDAPHPAQFKPDWNDLPEFITDDESTGLTYMEVALQSFHFDTVAAGWSKLSREEKYAMFESVAFQAVG
ncbi:MAG: tetratricopeptide repeat protein, partial [Steroidobacteraceae bacterium]